jgi:hypothetical protein
MHCRNAIPSKEHPMLDAQRIGARTRCAFIVFAVAAGLADPAGASDADDMVRTCQAYARETAKYQETVEEKGCQFPASPRWTDTVSQRFAWCVNTWRSGDWLDPFDDGDGKKVVMKEWNDHRNMANLCNSCANYADTAAVQSMLNSRHQCGGTGTRWEPDREFHLEWCLATDDARIRTSEHQIRQTVVKQCVDTSNMVKNALALKRAKDELRKKSKQNRISAVQARESAFEAEPKSLPAGEPLFEELPRGGLGEFPRSADTGGFEPVPIPGVGERVGGAVKEKVVEVGEAARDKISDYREAHADEIKATTDKAKVKLKRRLQDVSEAIKKRRAESKATAGPSKLKAATKAALTRAVNRSRKSGLLSRLSRR